MTNSPAISVVVPMYNVERYVKFCVDSILTQTFQDFEIILVDDASIDAGVELCKKFYGDNDKIKIIRHKKNLGPGSARNTGMKHARGKYIAFVDGDDFILPDSLEKFYNAAEKNNAQIVHAAGWYELTQDEPEPVSLDNLQIKWDPYADEGFLVTDPLYRLEERWKVYGTHPMAWLHFCRRDFIEKIKLEFLPLIAAEDEIFSFALFFFTERYYIIREAMYIYRRRNGSIMKKHDLEKFPKIIHSMKLGADYVKNLLDRLPRFQNYDQWCESVVDSCFTRLVNNHTVYYYKTLNVDPEVNAVAKDALKKIFGNNEHFVRYFFNSYHRYRRQAELLMQRNRDISAQVMALFTRMELSDNKIVFVTDDGYVGDPKYIAEEILRQNLSCDLVWLVHDANQPLPKKIRKVVYGGVDSIYELATAKIIVTDSTQPLPFAEKKDGQFLIATHDAEKNLPTAEEVAAQIKSFLDGNDAAHEN